MPVANGRHHGDGEEQRGREGPPRRRLAVLSRVAEFLLTVVDIGAEILQVTFNLLVDGFVALVGDRHVVEHALREVGNGDVLRYYNDELAEMREGVREKRLRTAALLAVLQFDVLFEEDEEEGAADGVGDDDEDQAEIRAEELHERAVERPAARGDFIGRGRDEMRNTIDGHPTARLSDSQVKDDCFATKQAAG